MNSLKLISYLLLIVLISGCTTPTDSSSNANKPSNKNMNNENNLPNNNKPIPVGTVYKLGETITVGMKDEISVGDLNMRYFKMVSDNRCPQQVNCMVAGEAKGIIYFNRTDMVTEKEFIAKGLCKEDKNSCGNAINVFGYNVKLLNIDPYPVGSVPKNFDNYTARIVVTKSDE